MKTSDFDYHLPPELIAHQAREPRDAARLFLHRASVDESRHLTVAHLPELLEPGDLLVMNDTRVLPARLRGRRSSGAAVEFLCLRPRDDRAWLAMARPAARLRPGELIELEDGEHSVLALERCPADDSEAPGLWAIELQHRELGAVSIPETLERIGRMPLPPYIKRWSSDDPQLDRERYQTVYATRPGAVAAPTAGLHLTRELIERLGQGGVETATVTLHVGPGTFRPVTAEDIDRHVMHREVF